MMTVQTKPVQAGWLPSIDPSAALDKLDFRASKAPVSKWVGEIYKSAPAAERSRLLEHLLKPLSLLSLVAVANGVFADMLFRSGSQMLHIRLEDSQNVHIDDVIALVDHVQQVSVESIESLVQMFTACSVMAGSTAAALLVSVREQQTKCRQALDVGNNNLPASPA